MTTRNSPLRVLKLQAIKIARAMKKAEQGKDPHPSILKAREEKDTLKAGTAMYDKIITIEMTWDLIKSSTEESLIEYILNQMLETKGNPKPR